MDPKVCNKLLTTHRRGLGDDVEALRGRFPSGGVPAKAPRWDLADTYGCGGGIRFSWSLLMVSGYGCIYRRKSRSVDARGAHEGGGRAGHPRGCLACFLISNPSPLDTFVPKRSLPKVSSCLDSV